jgi:hypothetical protein
MGTQLNSQPPPILERIVRWLVPPASREHVLGDLSERYRSPLGYLADALLVIPFVIGSQLRRSCNFAVLGVIAFTGYGVFTGPGTSPWFVAAIPTVVFIATLALRDAYRTNSHSAAREAAIDVGLGAFFVLIWQGIASFIATDLLLARPVLFVMLPILCAITFFVRMQRAPAGLWPPPIARALSREELEQEVRGAEVSWRRSVRIEIGAAVFVSAIGLLMMVRAKDNLGLLAGLLAFSGAAFVGTYMYARMRPVVMPNDMTFAGALSHYRGTLLRRLNAARTYMWWYALPLAPASLVIAIGVARRAAEPVPSLIRTLLGLALIGTLLYAMSLSARKRIQQRIDQLQQLKEKA